MKKWQSYIISAIKVVASGQILTNFLLFEIGWGSIRSAIKVVASGPILCNFPVI